MVIRFGFFLPLWMESFWLDDIHNATWKWCTQKSRPLTGVINRLSATNAVAGFDFMSSVAKLFSSSSSWIPWVIMTIHDAGWMAAYISVILRFHCKSRRAIINKESTFEEDGEKRTSANRRKRGIKRKENVYNILFAVKITGIIEICWHFTLLTCIWSISRASGFEADVWHYT